MAIMTFDRATTLAWLRGSAKGMTHERAEDYGDFAKQDGGPLVVRADETHLETLVEDFQDEGPGFGTVRVHAWTDDLILNDEPGIHLTVDVPVPGDESTPLRLSGTWAGLRGWVNLDETVDLAATLTDYLAAVANDANAVVVHARMAVKAGALGELRPDLDGYCYDCRNPDHDQCPGEEPGCPCCADTEAAVATMNVGRA